MTVSMSLEAMDGEVPLKQVCSHRSISNLIFTAGFYGHAQSYRIQCPLLSVNFVCQSCTADMLLRITNGNQACVACPTNATCSGSTEFLCNEGNRLVNSACSLCAGNTYKSTIGNTNCTACPSNATCSSTSFTCNSGFVRVGNGCFACPSDANCTTGDTICYNGFYLQNGICNLCPSNALCTANNLQCNNGFYLRDNQCLSCPANATCTSNDFTCRSGYFQNGTNTCVLCPTNASCSTGDIVCNDGFYRDGSRCLACPQNAVCTLNQFVCNIGFYLGGVASCLACPQNATCDSTSFVCVDNYYSVGGRCELCSVPCQSCPGYNQCPVVFFTSATTSNTDLGTSSGSLVATTAAAGTAKTVTSSNVVSQVSQALSNVADGSTVVVATFPTATITIASTVESTATAEQVVTTASFATDMQTATLTVSMSDVTSAATPSLSSTRSLSLGVSMVSDPTTTELPELPPSEPTSDIVESEPTSEAEVTSTSDLVPTETLNDSIRADWVAGISNELLMILIGVGVSIYIIGIVVVIIIIRMRRKKAGLKKNMVPVEMTMSPQIESNSAFTMVNAQGLNSASDFTTFNEQTMFNTTQGRSGHEQLYWIKLTASLFFPAFLEVAYQVDYRPTVKIAHGAMAEVYHCEILSPHLKQRVGGSSICIAKISKKTTQDMLFRQEISLMQHIHNHPNITKIIGFSNTPLVMLMEYFPEGSLRSYTKKNKLSRSTMAYLVGDIARGLRHMHALMIAHCDIKTDNVLLKNGKRRLVAALADFGISRILKGKSMVAGFMELQVDGASVRYASPDALMRLRTGIEHDSDTMKAGDVYGVGLIIYELLSGVPPWLPVKNK